MTHMIFRHGDMKKWKGVGYDFEIVKAEEIQEYLDAGWFAHPDDWICPYISRHLLSLNPLLACCRRYSRGER
ncbi:hypothetical protein LMB17_03795 [Escherichia coli]|uniref:hypothetical protein n=1 Tax=Escherichia coli TaxID=562 RepID=UPI001FF321DD|nr:hypothetical protein [Escherichia coli]UOY27659.1 hypothetical protein LMB17_03795 [Escherichia coli]